MGGLHPVGIERFTQRCCPVEEVLKLRSDSNASRGIRRVSSTLFRQILRQGLRINLPQRSAIRRKQRVDLVNRNIQGRARVEGEFIGDSCKVGAQRAAASIQGFSWPKLYQTFC